MKSLVLSLFAALVSTAALADVAVPPLTTGYVVEEGQRIDLWQTESGELAVHADRNSCRVDQFGNAGGCTRMAFPTKFYTLSYVATSVAGETLFALQGEPSLRLVLRNELAGGTTARLLKLDGESIVKIYRLAPR